MLRFISSFIFSGIFMLSFAQAAQATAPSCKSLFAPPTKHEIEMALALKAGLHYSTEVGPGMTREIDGSYRNSLGNKVTGQATLTRIDALAIPPGYSNVWISEDPRAHIQARALDSKSRPQYRYHEDWVNKVLTESKFSRMKEFGQEISSLKKVVDLDLSKEEIDEDSKISAIVRLLEVAGIRIGNEKYSADGGSYGLSTLEVRHALVRGSQTRFQFVAKEGIPQDIVIDDAKIARVVTASMKNKAPTDKLFDVDSHDVNHFIKAYMGDQFSAKDFRTWVATTLAAQVLHELGPKADPKQAMKQAAEEVSKRLHNTPAIARDSYIAPFVFEAYLQQKLESAFSEEVDPALSPAENAVLFLSH